MAMRAMMVIAMAASYDPDDANPGQVRLPFDLHTCRLDEQRWARWLAHVPLNLVEQHAEALRSLRCLYVDTGNRDQYNIQYGTHSGLDWRLDTSLPLLAGALGGIQHQLAR